MILRCSKVSKPTMDGSHNPRKRPKRWLQIVKFFDIFLKLKEMTSTPGFLDYDVRKDGWMTPKEFQKAMEQQKVPHCPLSSQGEIIDAIQESYFVFSVWQRAIRPGPSCS